MKLAAAVALIALATGLTGCGGGDPTSGADTVAKARLYSWLKGPSRQFLVRGGDNIVQTFGQEATLAEREQASRVIHKWMQARAAQAWTRDCSYFASSFAKALTKDAHAVTGGKAKTCPQALAYFGHEASGSYKNTLDGPIDSLRIGKGHGYAQYHGSDGHDWIIPVARDHGRWLVAAAAPLGRSS
jgi:hypothetical protein